MSESRKTPVPGLPAERPLVTVDLAVFCVREGELHALLVRRPESPGEPFPDRWALPGGFVDVDRDASLEACARRKLAEKTGVALPYLEQLGSWGTRDRDPRGWSTTHVYFALIAPPAEPLVAGGNAADVRWETIGSATPAAIARRNLAFDHAELLAAAVDRLRHKAEYTSLGAYLVAEPFTLGDLQRAYEAVLGRPLDKSSFRTRIMAAGIIVATGETRAGPKRPAQLYRLAGRAPAFFPRTFEPR